ncbi:MAG: signal peptide peptidase SppA [Pyrinomonadaceae bacterium]|nr:signal peptide peptidase SppA [Pyrinomonadaceae bacterium]
MAISKTAKVFLILGGIITAFVLVGLIGFAILADRIGRPSVPDNSVLVINVSGNLPDHTVDDPLAQAFGMGEPRSFSNMLLQLKMAKADARIGAVLLDINFPGIGWGKADELREAIKDFRTSGKPIYSFMELGMNKEYYIASAAEKVFLTPAGDIYINGLAANAMFYRGSLDKLGVEPDFIKIGKYKNAPDQYMRKDMSDEQREVLNAILDNYYGNIVNAISTDRKKTPEDVKAIIDGAPYHAKQALELGLIDGASYRDQVYDELKNRLGYKAGDELRTISDTSYKDVSPESLNLNKGERIAVVYGSGAINVGKSQNSPLGGEMMGSDTMVQAINSAAKDDSIKAIVLRVDSPGGSALASDLMWHAIEEAKKKKPVVVSMADVAASGGYYISCNANRIVAMPNTITGSIGVFMGKPNVKGLYDWLGVSNEYVLRGKNAGIFRETENWTPEERAKMENQTNIIYYDDFVPKVAAGRNKSAEEVNNLGQGRVWTGVQAKENGLIDDFGGLDKAVAIAKELAGIPAENEVKRVAFPKEKTLLETLFDRSGSVESEEIAAQRAIVKSLPEDARRALRFAEMLDRMSNGEAMLIMPFELEIK